MLVKIVKFISQKGIESKYKDDPCPAMLPIIENISYENSSDDLQIINDEHKLDIIYPIKEKEVYPFIINIHGGGFGIHSKDSIYRHYGMRLAGNEFAVVNINYSLTPENIFPAQVLDVLMVINFLSKNAREYKLDKNNMFLAGDSAGAYLGTMTGCILKNEVMAKRYDFKTDMDCRAIAANCGMFDFTTFMDKEIIFPMKRQIVEKLFGRRDFENSVHYPYSSVLEHINERFPPTYIMDTQVRSFEKEGKRLAEKLKEFGVDYRLHIFDKRDNLMHAFNIASKYPQSGMVLEEIFTFFNKQRKR